MNTVKKYNQVSETATRFRFITLCPQCGDAKCDRYWHSAHSVFTLGVGKELDVITSGICTGCQKNLEKVSLGVLYLNNVPECIHNQVVACLQEEMLQDCFDYPEHKVLDFVYTAHGHMVAANNAATTRSLAKKLEDTFAIFDVRSTYETKPQVRQLIEVEFMSPQ